ncbi:MAG: squalene/phytoene synthase family protein [Pseudomonadota bacterium]
MGWRSWYRGVERARLCMKASLLIPSPAAPGTTPQQAVDAVVAAAQSSFAIGIRLLAAPRRSALRTIYAFCRIVDDVADGPMRVAEKQDLLARWRAEIERCYQEVPQSSIGQALAPIISIYDLPKAEFMAIIDGMGMDVEGPLIAPDRDTLDLYVRRVAGAPGLMSMRVFGSLKTDASARFALDLARALQLTNILRDVEEDAAMGRIYLPADIMDSASLPLDPELLPDHPSLPRARRSLGAEAQAAFAAASEGARQHSRRQIAPALAMLGIYRAYLKQMQDADWCPPRSFRLGRATKLRYALGAVVRCG